MSKALSYRPDIDGLRSVAVLPVVLFHLHLPIFTGGYIGVDVFFVISGYLITGILMREIERGDFSILRFYERRARRILPALFAVVAFSVVVGAVLFTPEEMENLAISVIGALLFVQNFVLGAQAGYFDAASETKPLLHIWSLAVEEQFYIFFPPLLWLMMLWLKRRATVLLLAFVFVISLAAAIVLMNQRPVFVFYMLPLRAWELLAGSLLAIMMGTQVAAASRLRDIISVAGLLAILLPAMLYTAETPFPGYTAIPPVAGATALIWAGGNSMAGRALSWRPLVFVGLISYSLYLWHWPLIAFHALVFPDGAPLWHAFALFTLSMLLAILSWRFVEQPFRHNTGFWPHRKRVFVHSGLMMGAFLVLAGAIVAGKGWPWRAADEVVALADIAKEKRISDNQCRSDVALFTLRGQERGFCRLGAPGEGKADVVVWGDSHVGAWYPMLDTVFRESGTRALAISMAGCPIAFDIARAEQDKGGCTEAAEAIRSYIEREDIDRMLIVGSWFGAMTVKNTIYKDEVSHDDATRRANITRALADTGDVLRGMGVTTGFLMTAPGARHSVPEALFREARLGFYPEIRRTKAEYDATLSPVETTVRRHFDHVIPTADLLCPDTFCAVTRDGQPLYYDSNHPSLYLNDALLLPLLTRFTLFLSGD